MKISVDGEIKDLKAIDKNGFEWTQDLLGNDPSPSYHYDEDKEMYTMSADDFEWWSDIVDKLNKIEDMERELTSEELEEYHSESFVGDLEYTVEAQFNWLSEKMEAKNAEQKAHEVKFSDFYSEPSFFDTVDNVDVTIGSETVRCKITADFEEKPDMRGFGETFYNGGESRFSNKACDFAMVYVEIPNENGELESVELYAECDPKDVPGAGHYEKGEDEDGEWKVWVPDDDSASEKFLLVALEKAAEAVAKEMDIETPFHAPQIPVNEENSLLDSLYKKVNAEHIEFIADMHNQDTATAIESAYEIVWKGNIAQYLESENLNLTETQCNALLSSKNTLDELYECFLKEDGINSYSDLGFTFEDTADRIIAANEREREAHMNAPLILHDGQTARSLGENGMNDFRSSKRENRACAEAIIAAKNENTTYGDMAGVCYFNAEKAVDDVLKKGFTPERLGYVIASQVVRDQNYLDNPQFIDGRFSRAVKEWAISTFSQQENFPFRNFEDCDVTSAMHHTLVNSLAEKFIGKQAELSKAEKTNDESEKKPSVLGSIKELKDQQKAKEAEKPTPQKYKSNDQEL